MFNEMPLVRKTIKIYGSTVAIVCKNRLLVPQDPPSRERTTIASRGRIASAASREYLNKSKFSFKILYTLFGFKILLSEH